MSQQGYTQSFYQTNVRSTMNNNPPPNKHFPTWNNVYYSNQQPQDNQSITKQDQTTSTFYSSTQRPNSNHNHNHNQMPLANPMQYMRSDTFNKGDNSHTYNSRNRPPNFNSRSQYHDEEEEPENDDPFYCHICDRGYRSEDGLKQHESEDHIPCAELGCKYAAPLHLLEVHKMRHAVISKDGKSILDDPEEIKKWVEARKRNYPRQNQSAQNKTSKSELKNCCAIERVIRNAMSTASGRNNMDANGGAVKLVQTGLATTHARKEGISLPTGFDETLLRNVRIGGSNYTKGNQGNGKLICKTFFLKGRCKHGRNCKFAHVRPGDDQLIGTPLEYLRPRRPTLVMQLLAKDVEAWEGKLLAAFRYLVDSNFLENNDEMLQKDVEERSRRNKALSQLNILDRNEADEQDGEESSDGDIDELDAPKRQKFDASEIYSNDYKQDDEGELEDEMSDSHQDEV